MVSVLVCVAGSDALSRELSRSQGLTLADPLYLDPSYYDAYYGYWTDVEAPTIESLA
jgi:hypothetical protein